MEINIKPFM